MAIVTTHVAAVQQLYVAYFGRPADVAGLEYWTNIVEAQGTTVAVSATFATSPEYTALFAGMNNGQIVDKIYSNLFGRPADAGGRAYWVELLTAGTISVDNIVYDVSRAAVGTDAEIIENKVAGSTAFTNALDTAAEQAGYAGTAALTLAKQFVTGITTDASLTTAMTNLNTTVAAVVTAGTPFTLTSGLAALQAVTAAKDAFLDAADGTVDGKIAADAETKIAEGVTKAVQAVESVGGVDGYEDAATPNLRAALVADKVAANNTALATAQAAVTTANTEIAKVAGLQAAVTSLTAATTAKSNADKALVTAKADLAAKEASYEVLTGTTIDTAAAGFTGAITGVTKLNAAGTAVVAETNVTETTNPGVTALIASINAKLAADTAVSNAVKAEASAQATVNYLDMGTAEVTRLETVKGLMTDVSVPAGALPTLAQIATQKAIFQAESDAAGTTPSAELTAFNNAVSAYETASIENVRVKALSDATKLATDANKAIADLTKATADLTKAQGMQTQLDSADAAIAAAKKAFVDGGLVAPVEITKDASIIATSASDIYVAGKDSGSINLFGLLGNDALYIGTNYTLNSTATWNATTGAITGGNNGVLEAFIFNDTNGAHIVLEKSAFGSAAATPEVITITLVGVDAADVQLNNGIITTV